MPSQKMFIPPSTTGIDATSVVFICNAACKPPNKHALRPRPRQKREQSLSLSLNRTLETKQRWRLKTQSYLAVVGRAAGGLSGRVDSRDDERDEDVLGE
eukprot:3303329-Rhodomonas_salina.2